ncbi:MAG: hypothetical protein ACD_81C00076G0005 [uncultured bacterium]|uniref:Branched chain amino acid ABC transporter n=1 Tax=Candidatus Wolfebacteria bacterium GW2011_GWE2_44_13 TaxID=1619017 RepID=A0A0G1H9J3_9BACT|nr:MAG: hypothetical protein ACD_81C00076G0005 [uncultured bacterium]KKT43183.1 MAG: Branched chain amino acid ABC transporter [Candidatus Wolfebacteria bacterium GW2011_GWE2_44_13]
MHKIIKIALILGICTAVIGSGYFFTKSTKGGTIDVGAIVPFTGSSAVVGELIKNGLEIAAEEINSKGGVNGKVIKLMFEDNQTKTEVGLSAFMKLKDINKVKYVITSVSGVALAISPVANENKIVQMDVVAATPKYSTPDDFTFRTGVSSYFFAREMAKLMIDRNIKDAGILFVNTEYGQGFKDVFQNEYTERGGVISVAEGYGQEDKDFRTQLTKIKSRNPEALLLVSLQKEASTILKQMGELKMDTPIYSDVYAMEQESNLKLAENLKIYYFKPTVDYISSDAATTFENAYKNKYGKEPDFIAAQAYDGINLLVAAIQKCNDYKNTVCVKDALYALRDVKGVISEHMDFDVNGDIMNRPLELRTIIGGKFVGIKT